MDHWNSDSAVTRGDVFDAFAAVLKAIANGRRLELVELLAQGEHSVEELSRLAGAAVTTTSMHLQTLKRAGLVRTRKEGTMVFYRLAGDDVAALFVAGKRVALTRSAELRDTVTAYLADPASTIATIDPSAITSEMTVLDVRPVEEYEAGHFPGAVSIPMAELSSRYLELPTASEVVVYCRGQFCRLAREAAHWLAGQGFAAKAMDEGVIEWRATEVPSRVDHA